MYAKIEAGAVIETMGLPPHPWTYVPQAEQEYAGWYQVNTSALDGVNRDTQQIISQTVVVEAGRPVLQVITAPRPQEEIAANFISAAQKVIQERLDAWAQDRGYDGILSLCSYAASRNPQFSADAQRGVALRDETWATCYEIMVAVQSGERPMPSLAEVLAELPELAWPT